MPVSDDQMATLRAYLTGDPELYQRLYDQLDPGVARRGYATLVAAAFFKAVYRRFGHNGTGTDVINFVSDVRGRSGRLAEGIDPRTAERVIRAALTDEDISDLPGSETGRMYGVLVGSLVSDEQLDDAGLDEFLAEARKLADQWVN